MLHLMRKHAKSWIVSLMIAAISIVFIFYFGTGSWRQQDVSKVAEVNGEPISYAQFKDQYNRLLDLARRQYGDLLTEDLLEALNLKRQALESLINEHLVFQQARALGLSVSANDVQAAIAEQPYFQVDGRFNQERYLQMVVRMGLSPAQFEEGVRQERLSGLVQRLVGNLAHVSMDEAKDFFHHLRDRLDLDYALFPPEYFRPQVHPTEEEVQAYFSANKEKYRMPPQVKVMYLAFRPSFFETNDLVTEKDIAQYYEINLGRYAAPEHVKASHILFRLEPSATPEEEARVKAKAEEVLKKVQEGGGENFADLAKEYSDDPTAQNGGDLGWFGREEMLQEFSDAAFGLEKGAISGLVKTQFGYHIIKVEDRRPAGYKPLEEVRDEIAAGLMAEKSGDAARRQAESVYDQIALSQDFEGTAEKLGLVPLTTRLFSEKDPLLDVVPDPAFTQALLNLKKGEIGPLLEQQDGLYLVKCLDRIESYLPELEDVRGLVEEDLAQEQSEQKARAAAVAFLAEAEREGGWEAALAALARGDLTGPENPWSIRAIFGPLADKAGASGIETGQTGPFSRTDQAPQIGGGQDLIQAAFALREGQAVPEPLENEKGFVVFRVREKIPAAKEDFESEQDKILEALRTSKERAYFTQWLEEVRKQSSIDVDERVL
ncbi:MAG: SurA N-terminal domain-containing protein [Thermodesulfobacteriota bacterium]